MIFTLTIYLKSGFQDYLICLSQSTLANPNNIRLFHKYQSVQLAIVRSVDMCIIKGFGTSRLYHKYKVLN